MNIRVIDVSSHLVMTCYSESSYMNELGTTKQTITSTADVPIGALVTTVQSVQQSYEAYFPAYEITVDNETDPIVLGLDYYTALTDEQKHILFTLTNI